MAKKKEEAKASEAKEEKKPVAEVAKATKEEKPVAKKKEAKAPKPVPSAAPAGYNWVKVTQEQVMQLQKERKLAGFWPPTMEALIKEEEK